MYILLLSVAMPAIMMVVVIITTPQTEGTMIKNMIIHSCIIAMSKVYTIVSTAIRIITYRYAEVEVVSVLGMGTTVFMKKKLGVESWI